MKVRVYVEGGGSESETLALCRKAFHDLFDGCCQDRKRPKFITSGGRSAAFEDFCIALVDDSDYYSILLVDSEGPIRPGLAAWDYLKNRAEDQWDKPAGAASDQAHLMVQCMESWFLADKRSLADYYRDGFLVKGLPGNPDIEAIPKADVCRNLEHATGRTRKGCYHKVRHGFAIVGKLDFSKVCECSARARAFRDVVLSKLDE